MNRLASIGLFAALTMVAEVGQAQTKTVEFIKAVPDAPAFTFLAATPSTVDRPGNLRDLGVAVVNGVGEDGKVKQGFAVDASVWNLIPGHNIPLNDYRNNFLQYALGNLQASIATVRASGDTADLVAAFGLKAVLLDRGDPMLSDSVTTALAAGLARCVPDQPGLGQTAACVDSVAADVIGTYTSTQWNASQLALAAAWGARLDNAELDRSNYDGMQGWLTGALRLGSSMQLLAQATYKDRAAVDTVPAYRAVNTGVRLIAGSATFNGFVEFAREWRTADDTPTAFIVDEKVGGWSAGAEFRLAPNTWIATGLGTQFTSLEESDRTVVFANVKWGISSAARIATLRQ